MYTMSVSQSQSHRIHLFHMYSRSNRSTKISQMTHKSSSPLEGSSSSSSPTFLRFRDNPAHPQDPFRQKIFILMHAFIHSSIPCSGSSTGGGGAGRGIVSLWGVVRWLSAHAAHTDYCERVSLLIHSFIHLDLVLFLINLGGQIITKESHLCNLVLHH